MDCFPLRGLYKIGRDGILKKEISASDRVVSEQIRSFVEDDQNNVWFGTFDGLQMYRPSTDTYCVYRPNFIRVRYHMNLYFLFIRTGKVLSGIWHLLWEV